MTEYVFFLREPGMVPEKKTTAPGNEIGFLRELMDARPSAFITVVSIDVEGNAFPHDGPEFLEIMDRRSRDRAARHRASSLAAFAAHHAKVTA